MSELDYKKLYEEQKKKVSVLTSRLDSIEINGSAKLYYSLNRNMSDLADMLDGIKLKEVTVNDSADKTMERLKIIWTAITPIVTNIGLLKESAGVTGDEKKDTARKGSFLDKAVN